LVHNTFKSTNRGMKLADHVHNTHLNLPSLPTQGRIAEPHIATRGRYVHWPRWAFRWRFTSRSVRTQDHEIKPAVPENGTPIFEEKRQYRQRQARHQQLPNDA
jgi:hypothetical protein